MNLSIFFYASRLTFHINKESQPQQAVGYSLIRNPILFKKTKMQDEIAHLQMGTNKDNHSMLGGME